MRISKRGKFTLTREQTRAASAASWSNQRNYHGRHDGTERIIRELHKNAIILKTVINSGSQFLALENVRIAEIYGTKKFMELKIRGATAFRKGETLSNERTNEFFVPRICDAKHCKEPKIFDTSPPGYSSMQMTQNKNTLLRLVEG